MGDVLLGVGQHTRSFFPPSRDTFIHLGLKWTRAYAFYGCTVNLLQGIAKGIGHE